MAYDFTGNLLEKREIIEVDLHNLNVWEARERMDKVLAFTDPELVEEIVVIHGHKKGKALQKFVRKELDNHKIDRKFLSMNDGRTSLILKRKA